jgi:hypothetical protein
MDDEPAVDEEGEDALYEYLFGHEAAVSWEGDESREPPPSAHVMGRAGHVHGGPLSGRGRASAAQGPLVAGHLAPRGI